jgi:hypothetical protein
MGTLDLILDLAKTVGDGLTVAARRMEEAQEMKHREEMRKVETLKAYGIDPMQYNQAAYYAKKLAKGAVTWSYSCRCGFSERVRGNKKRNDNCPKCGKHIQWYCNPD